MEMNKKNPQKPKTPKPKTKPLNLQADEGEFPEVLHVAVHRKF